jgi:hypothetical protein
MLDALPQAEASKTCQNSHDLDLFSSSISKRQPRLVIRRMKDYGMGDCHVRFSGKVDVKF